MSNKAQSTRIACEAKCILYFDGFDFQGVIINLSLSGALIELNEKIPDHVRPDNMCNLMICTNPDLYPIKYTCKVIRVDSEMIGLQFLELNII